MIDKTVYYPYNDFGFYYGGGIPLAGKRAHKFVEERNACKGGHWELHTVEQYREWYRKKGQHLEYLSHKQLFDLTEKARHG